MFGFIADILTSVTSILFPVFASYKALRSSDPALLTPWLMYWTTLSLFLLVESQLYFILYWIPFYSWIRLGVHLYLVLPGKQGSVYIYKTHINPFLEEHERQIDTLITNAHAKAKAAGLDIVKQAVEYVRVQVLGQAPRQPTPPTSRNVSYSAALMNRFNMPSARAASSMAAAAGGSDLFSLLGKAMNQSTYPTSTSREAQADDLASSGIIPPDLSGTERSDFVNTQRERLRTLLQAFDQEAFTAPADDPFSAAATSSSQPRGDLPRNPSGRKSYLAPPDDMGYMHKSRSESEFEDLAYEPMPDPEQFRPSSSRPSSRADVDTPPVRKPVGGQGSGSQGWSNWVWGNYGERDSAARQRKGS